MKRLYNLSVVCTAALSLTAIVAGADIDPLAPDGDVGSAIPGGTTTGNGVVTFESLNIPAGEQIELDDGEALTVEGFTFTPGPNNNSGLNDSHYGHAVSFWGYNGTHVTGYHDDIIITKADGGAFDLIRFDLAGLPDTGEVPFSVTGQPGNVVADFTPDGVSDGEGGAVDFETFTVPASFRNLTSVTIEHSGSSGAHFHIDNVVTTEPISVEPKGWGEIKAEYR